MSKKPAFSISVLLLLVGLSLATYGCDYITGEAVKLPAENPRQIVKDITAIEAQALIQVNSNNKDFIIIDVRTPEEYAEGHIQNAVNLDYNSVNFGDEINSLDRNRTYLIYCRTGRRSAGARDIMKGLGFQKIFHMTGGITDWITRGLPVVK